jgi:hypothetical protein
MRGKGSYQVSKRRGLKNRRQNLTNVFRNSLKFQLLRWKEEGDYCLAGIGG